MLIRNRRFLCPSNHDRQTQECQYFYAHSCFYLMKNDIVRLGVGTIDGAYILSSDVRSSWNKTRRLMKGESVNYMISSPEGRLFASTLSDGIFISDDSRKMASTHWMRLTGRRRRRRYLSSSPSGTSCPP